MTERSDPASAGARAPAPRRIDRWSIGIYTGPSALELSPAGGVINPVLTWRDITDIRAAFVADPFMVEHAGRWFMFFEILDADSGRGVIGLAVSDDARRWSYQGVVIEEPFHLSYPCTFRHGNDFYMVPETLSPRCIQIYRATGFPFRWSRVSRLLETQAADPSLFHHAGRWWMFFCQRPLNATLRLYHAGDLLGPWSEHPCSPVIAGDERHARPAGRVVRDGDRLVRYAQDCRTTYGLCVHAFEITELTPTVYRERPYRANPILSPGSDGWNRNRMHHVDAHATAQGGWIACVDGDGEA